MGLTELCPEDTNLFFFNTSLTDRLLSVDSTVDFVSHCMQQFALEFILIFSYFEYFGKCDSDTKDQNGS